MARKIQSLTAKRMVMLAGTVILAGGMLTGAWSYSSAQVTNEASVTVVESKDALVAVDVYPVCIVECNGHRYRYGDGCGDGHKGWQWRNGDGDCLENGYIECGTITNNTAGVLDLTISGDDSDVDFNATNDSLLGGGSTEFFINPPESGTFQGLIQARNDAGDFVAEINFEVEATVCECQCPGCGGGFGPNSGDRQGRNGWQELQGLIGLPLLEGLDIPGAGGSDNAGGSNAPGSAGGDDQDGTSGSSDGEAGSDNATGSGTSGDDLGGASAGLDSDAGGDNDGGGDTPSVSSSGDPDSGSQESGSSDAGTDDTANAAGGNPGE